MSKRFRGTGLSSAKAKRRAAVSVCAAALLASTSASGQQDAPVYKQASAPVADRVADLLARMTLDEKIAQLKSSAPIPIGKENALGLLRDGEVDIAVAKRTLSNGLGTLVLVGTEPIGAVDLAKQQNAIQSYVVNNTRLGIPILFQGEGLHGAVVGGGTSYPQAVAIGSTWNRALTKQMFSAVGKESRAAGIGLLLAPVFDLARDPRYGRVEEMYSEDPYLVGEMGLAAVQGLQGENPASGAQQVVATAKHFIHGQPENGTNVGPSDFSERTMRNVFMPPFEKSVRIGKIGAVMPSYNENEGGIPSSANPWLLKNVLRGEWGFTGLTVSDWFAIPELHEKHFIAPSVETAGVLAFNSGVDMELPTASGFVGLADAVRAGKVSESDLNAAVARVLTAKFNVGLFEHPLTDLKRTSEVVGSQAHAKLARTVADQAIILLKNQGGLLPLDPKKLKSIAVIGPNADKVRLGTYSGVPPYFSTVLDGIRKRVGSGVSVTYAEGVRISEPDKTPAFNSRAAYAPPSPEKDTQSIAEAIETAKASDVVVLVLGGNETVSREAFAAGPTGKALGDTDTLALPGRQDELVREVVKLGKPVVAVLLNGRPYSISALNDSVPAIVEGWYLGQETGNAVAGILFGDVNPSGRLPVTIARNVGQLPVFYYKTPSARLGYVFDDNKPLYPFGFGLSYTTFTYGKPTVALPRIKVGGSTKVSVAVTNSGSRAGDEVVQMYLRPKFSSVVQPVMRLAGFNRIRLNPRQTATVSFDIGAEELAILNRQMKRAVEPGMFDVMIGPDVENTQSVQIEVAP